MTVRERYETTLRSIIETLKTLPPGCKLIFADGATPKYVREQIKPYNKEGVLEAIYFKTRKWPNQIRKRVIGRIKSKYVIFIDNDVIPSEGWIEHLIDCAEVTSAAIVAPLYLIGRDPSTDTIHMAGGRLSYQGLGHTRSLYEEHRLSSSSFSKHAPHLLREEVDFGEYHCLFMRTKFAKTVDVFFDGIYAVHEHIHASLMAKKHGMATYFEPKSVVTYCAYQPLRIQDRKYFVERWDPAKADHSLVKFCEYWHLVDDGHCFEGIRGFVKRHQRMGQILNTEGVVPESRAFVAKIKASDVANSRSELFALAMSLGLTEIERLRIDRCCELSTVFMNGGYRPCGRPFVNHLIGAASILAWHGVSTEIICAGLMHSLLQASPLRGDNEFSKTVAASISRLAPDSAHIVAIYSQWQRRLKRYPYKDPLEVKRIVDGLTVLEAKATIVLAADFLEMCLSGEYLYSRRINEFPDEGFILFLVETLKALEMFQFAQSLIEIRADTARTLRKASPIHCDARNLDQLYSYRYDGATKSPMIALDV
ncbi:glycosyltransferase [Synechococcus sp. CBW1006]|nr:glycosyltransferase [Synechococcus sp. CBW1006]